MDRPNHVDPALHAFADLFVDAPRYHKVNQALEESMLLKRRAPNAPARNLVLTSPSGMGKTNILKRFLRRINQEAELRDPGAKPCIFFSLSNVTIPKDFSSTLLRSMGDSFAGRLSHSEQMVRAYDFMDKLKIELIFIDEFSHVLLKATDPMKAFAEKFMKDLVNSSNRTIVLAGLRIIESFIQNSEELRRRFITKLRIPRFHLNTKDGPEFRKFMEEVDIALPIPVEESFASERMVLAWYCMSGGIPDYIFKPLMVALGRALDDQQPVLTLEALAMAAEGFLDPDGKSINPFTSSMAELNRAVQLLYIIEKDVTKRFEPEFEQIRFPWLDEV